MQQAVTVVRTGSLTNPQTYIADYQEVIARATAQATVLMKIVEERKLFTVQQGGRRFLHFEAWQLVGAFDNAAVAVDHTTPIEENGVTIGYMSKVNVLKDGQVISAAEAVCFLDESVAKGRSTESGKKQAAMSMAQTRAASKALRMKYSAVAVLAGFQPTPADEMPSDDGDGDAAPSAQRQQPATPRQTAPRVQNTTPQAAAAARNRSDSRLAEWLIQHGVTSPDDHGYAVMDERLTTDFETSIAGFRTTAAEVRERVMEVLKRPETAEWLAQELASKELPA